MKVWWKTSRAAITVRRKSPRVAEQCDVNIQSINQSIRHLFSPIPCTMQSVLFPLLRVHIRSLADFGGWKHYFNRHFNSCLRVSIGLRVQTLCRPVQSLKLIVIDSYDGLHNTEVEDIVPEATTVLMQ
ncbi:hypothetical protein TNCV_2870571 [Trichonephila clavipes]|nr:hypothetical protein TNCV_2870571 [Trichonephila clavipes]